MDIHYIFIDIHYTLEYRINGGDENNRGVLGEIENSLFLRQTRFCYIFM